VMETDAGVEVDASPEPDAGEAPPPSLQGRLEIGEVHMNEFDMWMVGAGGSFYEAADLVLPTPMATVDGCMIYEGDTTPSSAGEPVDAGPLHVTGGAYDFDMQLTSEGYAAAIPRTVDDLFAGGETLTVSAEGGPGMPPFEGTVITPVPIEVLEPCLRCGLDVDRGAGFRITWAAGTEGELHLELTGGGVAVACSVPDSAGELTVSPEALGYLPATGNGMLMFRRTGRSIVETEAALVTLEAVSTQCSMGAIR